jgi:hypothetical protein
VISIHIPCGLYSIQHYPKKLIRDLRQVFTPFSSTNKSDRHDLTEILLKVNSTQYFWNQNISHYNKTDATNTKYANGGKDMVTQLLTNCFTISFSPSHHGSGKFFTPHPSIVYIMQEEFEDTKGVIRIRISKKKWYIVDSSPDRTKPRISVIEGCCYQGSYLTKDSSYLN